MTPYFYKVVMKAECPQTYQFASISVATSYLKKKDYLLIVYPGGYVEKVESSESMKFLRNCLEMNLIEKNEYKELLDLYQKAFEKPIKVFKFQPTIKENDLPF